MSHDHDGLDQGKVIDLLESLEKRLAKLRELQGLTKTEFLGDFRNTDAAIYNLQAAVEAMIDVCNHQYMGLAKEK